jgi:Tfp pilus assembly protein PilO
MKMLHRLPSFHAFFSKTYLNYILWATGHIVLLFLGYLYLVKPDIQHVIDLKTQETHLRHQFMQQRRMININQYRKHTKQLQTQLDLMRKTLTTSQQMPELIRSIHMHGRKCGLFFELFSPKANIDDVFYTEVPVVMTVVGHYADIIRFLSHVSHMKKLITWHDFYLKRIAFDEQGGARLRLNVTAKLYKARL